MLEEEQIEPIVTAARGRELVLSGVFSPDSMIDNLCLIEHFRAERLRVTERGMCSDRCKCERVKHLLGHIVCPNTYQPCQRDRLAAIVAMWRQVG